MIPPIIALGQPHPYLTGRRLTEGVVLSIVRGDFAICAIYDHPTPTEIAAYQHDDLRVALVPAGDHTFFMMMKPGAQNWTDMPFALGLLDPDQRDVLPPRDALNGYLIHFELVDLHSHVVHGLRLFTITPAFSFLLELQIAKLRRNLSRFSVGRHSDEIAAMYRRYPDANLMTKAAIIIETAGMTFPVDM